MDFVHFRLLWMSPLHRTSPIWRNVWWNCIEQTLQRIQSTSANNKWPSHIKYSSKTSSPLTSNTNNYDLYNVLLNPAGFSLAYRWSLVARPPQTSFRWDDLYWKPGLSRHPIQTWCCMLALWVLRICPTHHHGSRLPSASVSSVRKGHNQGRKEMTFWSPWSWRYFWGVRRKPTTFPCIQVIHPPRADGEKKSQTKYCTEKCLSFPLWSQWVPSSCRPEHLIEYSSWKLQPIIIRCSRLTGLPTSEKKKERNGSIWGCWAFIPELTFAS